jgi:hypothetical protein
MAHAPSSSVRYEHKAIYVASQQSHRTPALADIFCVNIKMMLVHRGLECSAVERKLHNAESQDGPANSKSPLLRPPC